jgi:hypothetical protein
VDESFDEDLDPLSVSLSHSGILETVTETEGVD